MIPTAPFMSPEELLRHSQAICDGMSEDEDGLRREVLAHAGSRWSLGIIHALGVYGTLRHAEVARSVVAENCNCSDDKEALAVLTEENVVAQLNHLCTHPSVAAKLARGQLFIHGWVYDIETSQIKAYDAELGSFLPLDGDKIPMATPRARFPQS